MQAEAVMQTTIGQLPLIRRGKVRDVYDMGDALLIVATDRISCYDVVLPTPIPGKGAVLTLIDEVLTPDSSRFWPADKYAVGRSQPSFDKQYVRDYLNSIGWERKPPAPNLPEKVVQETSAKYREALRLLTQNGPTEPEIPGPESAR